MCYYEASTCLGAIAASPRSRVLFFRDEVELKRRVLINVGQEGKVWNCDTEIWIVHFRLRRSLDLVS